MTKKVLGISFGRKMSNCDIMVKQALMACEKQGCEVAFLRADDLNITNCTGCIACTIGLMTGRGRGYCVRHDDFDILDECVMQSDAVILACPTYETSATGRFKTVCDRIGPSHDITFRRAAYEEGKAAGKPESALPDARSFKKRTAALISVGGAMMVSALGMLFLVLTMLSDTLYYGISHSAAKRFTPFEMTYVMFIVGMVVFIPVGLIYAGGLHSPLITGPMHDGGFWAAVLYLGLLSSVLAYGLLNFANSHLSVSETSLFSNVTTVVSVLAGVVLLKEPFSVWQMLGVAVILVCVFVANVSGGKES